MGRKLLLPPHFFYPECLTGRMTFHSKHIEIFPDLSYNYPNLNHAHWSQMKKLVMKDIARLAGVSNSTVSKAINNYADIPDDTRDKIQKIISKYNYCPSKSAQTLRS